MATLRWIFVLSFTVYMIQFPLKALSEDAKLCEEDLGRMAIKKSAFKEGFPAFIVISIKTNLKVSYSWNKENSESWQIPVKNDMLHTISSEVDHGVLQLRLMVNPATKQTIRYNVQITLSSQCQDYVTFIRFNDDTAETMLYKEFELPKVTSSPKVILVDDRTVHLYGKMDLTKLNNSDTETLPSVETPKAMMKWNKVKSYNGSFIYSQPSNSKPSNSKQVISETGHTVEDTVTMVKPDVNDIGNYNFIYLFDQGNGILILGSVFTLLTKKSDVGRIFSTTIRVASDTKRSRIGGYLEDTLEHFGVIPLPMTGSDNAIDINVYAYPSAHMQISKMVNGEWKLVKFDEMRYTSGFTAVLVLKNGYDMTASRFKVEVGYSTALYVKEFETVKYVPMKIKSKTEYETVTLKKGMKKIDFECEASSDPLPKIRFYNASRGDYGEFNSPRTLTPFEGDEHISVAYTTVGNTVRAELRINDPTPSDATPFSRGWVYICEIETKFEKIRRTLNVYYYP